MSHSKWLFLVVLAFVGLAAAARAEDAAPIAETRASSAATKKELTGIVEAQLAAFRAGDFHKAYALAAPEIQGQFSQAEFEQMVRLSFPKIAHSAAAQFGLAFDSGDEAEVEVQVIDAQQQRVRYRYQLKKVEGHWRIEGVAEIEDHSLTVSL